MRNMRNNDSDSGRMGLRSYSPNSDNLTAGREGPQQQRKLKTNSRSANCTVHPTNGQIDGRCPDVTCEARRGVPYMTCRKMFYPLSPLCPQNLYCLSANLIPFLIPLPLLCGRHIWKPPSTSLCRCAEGMEEATRSSSITQKLNGGAAATWQ